MVSEALSNAQRQVQEARAKIEEQKKISQEAQEKVLKAKETLLSQRNLRNNNTSNALMGALRRRQGINQVGEVQSQIDERGKVISSYDIEVSKAEAEVADATLKEQGYEIAKRAIERDNPFIVHFSKNRYAKEYYEDMLNAENDMEELNSSLSKGVVPANVQKAIDNISAKVGEEKAYKIVLGWDKDEVRNFRDFQTEKINVQNLPPIEIEGTTLASRVPVNVLTKAPTLKEQYINRLKNENWVTGTLGFVGGLFGEKLQNAELRSSGKAYIQDSEFPSKVGEAVTNAPYFTPIALPYALASGLGQLTPGGIQQVKNAPSVTEKVLISGQAGLNIFVGGIGTANILGKAMGYPKFNTDFISAEISNADDLTRVKTFARTRQQGLFGNKDILSASVSDVKTLQNNRFGVKTSGVAREINSNIKGVGKPMKFASAEYGTAIPEEINVRLNKGTPEVYRVFEGSRIGSVGEVRTKVSGTIVKQRFGTLGATGNLNENMDFGIFKSVPYSRVNNILTPSKSGNVMSKGLFLKNNKGVQDSVFVDTGASGYDVPITKTTRSTLNAQSVAQQSQKNAIETALKSQAEAKATSIISNSNKAVAISPILKQDNVKTYTSGSQILEGETKQVTQPTTPTDSSKVSDNVIGFQGSSFNQRQDFEQLTKQNNKFNQDFSFKPAIKEAQGLGFNTALTTRQEQQQRNTPGQKNPTTKTPQKTIAPPIVFNLPKSRGSVIKSALKKLMGFDVYSKKKGKEIKIFENLPENLAYQKGSEFVKKTLRASFRLKPSGKETSVSDIGTSFNMGNVFRPSKRSSDWIVQKEKYRLSNPKEVSEIQFFKKAKKKKRFSLW